LGYEIAFHFHERGEDGKYDMDKQQSFTKTVGRKSAEVSLEQVAAVVLGQLARRDIWIVDVQVFEFAKREITFKETKNGVVLKNRKFHYDQICGHLISDEEDCGEQQQQYSPQQQPSPVAFSNNTRVPLTAKPPARDPNIPVRQELFRPNREDYPILQRQGIKLTMGKPYPIFNEVIKGGEFEPIYYVVQDDGGNRIEISSLFFEPMRRGLIGIGMNDPASPVSEGRLSYVDTSPISPSGDAKLAAYLAAQDAALMRRM
jgi:hypothetical protein